MHKRIASIVATSPATQFDRASVADAKARAAVDPAPVGDDLRNKAQAQRVLAQRGLITRQALLLNSMADFLGQGLLATGALSVCEGLKSRLDSERVSMGIRDKESIKLIAVSQQAKLDPRAPECRMISDVMLECCKHGEPLVMHPIGRLNAADDALSGSDEAGEQKTQAHRALWAQRPGCSVVSIPLCHQEQVIAVILIELPVGKQWTAVRHELLVRIATTLAPMVVDRRLAEQSILRTCHDRIRNACIAAGAPRNLVPKLLGATATLLLLALTLIPVEQRITASAELVPVHLRTITSPIAGYVRRVAVTAGESVQRDQILLELDTRALTLERDRRSGELAGIEAELRAVRAAGDRKRTEILKAKRDQVTAELDLAEQRIVRASVVAPHDGRIVSDQLDQLAGAPVERGQRLLELAPSDTYTVSLLVDERDIGLLLEGQSGTLTLQARPDQSLPLAIVDTHPIAIASNGSNHFRVEAALVNAPAALLPGQTGIGKVTVGEASIASTVTRRFLDWCVMRRWEWFGG